MFSAIVDGDFTPLKSLSNRFLASHHNPPAAILCLDSIFQRPININTAPADIVLQTLHNFATYIREVQKMLSNSDLCQRATVQKLFGITQSVDMDGIYSIRRESFLHKYLSSQPSRALSVEKNSDEEYLIHAPELNGFIQSAVRERVTRKTNDEDFVCSKAPALRLCPMFLIFNTCNMNCGCSHDIGTANSEAFRLRIRIILQQILICQSAKFSEDIWKQQTYVMISSPPKASNRPS
jgi:hypothetical protein